LPGSREGKEAETAGTLFDMLWDEYIVVARQVLAGEPIGTRISGRFAGVQRLKWRRMHAKSGIVS
jgi:hypothetical protein